MPTVFTITRTADKRVPQEPQIRAALERGETVIAKARGVQFACRLADAVQSRRCFKGAQGVKRWKVVAHL